MQGRLPGGQQADALAPCAPVRLACMEQQLWLHWLTLACCSLLTWSDTGLETPEDCLHSCWVHSGQLQSLQAEL